MQVSYNKQDHETICYDHDHDEDHGRDRDHGHDHVPRDHHHVHDYNDHEHRALLKEYWKLPGLFMD